MDGEEDTKAKKNFFAQHSLFFKRLPSELKWEDLRSRRMATNKKKNDDDNLNRHMEMTRKCALSMNHKNKEGGGEKKKGSTSTLKIRRLTL